MKASIGVCYHSRSFLSQNMSNKNRFVTSSGLSQPIFSRKKLNLSFFNEKHVCFVHDSRGTVDDDSTYFFGEDFGDESVTFTDEEKEMIEQDYIADEDVPEDIFNIGIDDDNELLEDDEMIEIDIEDESFEDNDDESFEVEEESSEDEIEFDDSQGFLDRKDFINLKDFNETKAFGEAMARVADEMKCLDIRLLNVQTKIHWTDLFLIFTATSSTQLNSVLGKMEKVAKEEWEMEVQDSITRRTEWECIDFGSLVIHAFSPRTREFYALEELYEKCEEIPVEFTKTDRAQPQWQRTLKQ